MASDTTGIRLSPDLSEAPPETRRALESLTEDPKIRALCVFGSVARGGADHRSDLDLLAVVPSRSDATAVRAGLKANRVRDSAQVSLMTFDSLKHNFEEMTVFASHLAREGRVIEDRDGRITAWLDSYPRNQPVRETAANLAAQLSIYDHLDWCAGHYLFCLADLYAWGRSGAMLVLAREAVFEFDRQKVFERLAERHPDLSEAASTVNALRPFWLLVRRNERTDRPFDPAGSHEETARARDACRAILQAGF
jgi:predicted nucleotidyltransferase